jgi:hypothetical protein
MKSQKISWIRSDGFPTATRKRVVVERPPQSAILHVTADSHYQVWIKLPGPPNEMQRMFIEQGASAAGGPSWPVSGGTHSGRRW